jgi:hypothetical protein
MNRSMHISAPAIAADALDFHRLVGRHFSPVVGQKQ